MSKKTWVLISCLVLSLALGLSGSLAYLTDTDSRTNTFTMGGVEIEIQEDFVQESPLKPGLETNKDAKIENKGDTDAWVWMTVEVPEHLAAYVAPVFVESDKFIELNPTYKEDGTKVYTVLVKDALDSGKTTEKILDAVLTSKTLDKQADGTLVAVVNGVPTPIVGDLQVIVNAFAIQKDGFTTVNEAYDAFNTQWGNTTPGEPGIEPDPGEDDDEPTDPDEPVEVTATELLSKLEEAAEATEEVNLNLKLTGDMPADGICITVPENATVVLDLNGMTITAASGNYAILNNGTLTIKNGTVTGKGQVAAITNYNVMTVDGVTVNTESEMYQAIGNRGSTKPNPYKYATLTLQGNTVVNGYIYNYFGNIIAGENEPVHNEGGNDNNKYNVTQNVDGDWTFTPIN